MVEPTETTIDGRKGTARQPRKAKQPSAAQPTLAARLRQAEAERDEALAQQTATAEVLQIINRSSGDPAPVFDAILERAMRLCDAAFGGLLVPDGEFIKYIAFRNVPERFTHFLTHNPVRLRTLIGPAFDTLSTLHVADLTGEEGYRRRVPVIVSAVEDGGIRTAVCVPLVRDGALIGVFTIYRQDVRPFAERQIALLESFAAQAAIAMENARLLTELRLRTGDLQESLEYQTATSDVLKVISRSTFDLQPVLDTLTETVERLCNSDAAGVTIRDGEVFRYRALHGVSDELSAALRRQSFVSSRDGVVGRTVLEGNVVHIADAHVDPEYSNPTSDDVHTMLGVPLLREGMVVGTFTLTRKRVEPFTQRQIELVRTFADQAVIAIENARLLTELRESLDRQTATADILRAIASTPDDPTRALDAIAETAARMFGGANVGIRRLEGDMLRMVATAGPANREIRDIAPERPLDSEDEFARAVRDNRQFHVPDAFEVLDQWPPAFQETVRRANIRTAAFTPLNRNGQAIGAMVVNRTEVQPFLPDELELMRGFADQAVIAIENARLLSELRESLDRQTATADILRAIASTPGDPTRALDTIAETAARLFGAANVGIRRLEGDMLHYIATAGPLGDPMRRQRPALSIDAPVFFARTARENRQIHVPDVPAEITQWPEDWRETLRRANVRTAAYTPLTRDGKAIGAMAIDRTELRPFRSDELELMKGFADQAVIAIENARLLTELRARTDDLQESLEYQTATSDVLKVISRSTFDLQPVLDTLAETAERLCAADETALSIGDGVVYRYKAIHGVSEEFREALLQQVVVPGRQTIAGRVALEGKVVHVADLAADPEFVMRTAVTVDRLGSVVGVPMLREGRVVGTFSLARRRVEPFTERQIELARTFADQAVIAIENARLLTELRESLDRQTAMSEILAVISATPGQVQPVFDKVLECALRLSRAHMGTINRVVDGIFTEAARIGAPSEFSSKLDNYSPPPDTPLGRMLAAKSTIRIDDYRATEGYAQRNPAIVSLVEQGGGRSAMQVPLLKDDVVVGAMTIYRPEVRPFGDQEATLAEDFAKQAVIAIENARLLTELRARTSDLQESLEYQTATSDVLKVISRSAFDLDTVLQTVATAAVRLCRADSAVVYRNNRGEYRWAAGHLLLPEYEERERNVVIRPGTGTVVGRAALEAHTVHILDAWTDPLYEAKDDAQIGGIRTMLGVPLLREGVPIGAFGLGRSRVEAFSEREIALVTTFADQAVIAIENARLLTELRARTSDLQESLEYQTAISDVLKVISRSTFDLQPVLDTLAQTSRRLCASDCGGLALRDGDVFCYTATYGLSDDADRVLREHPFRPSRDNVSGRAIIEGSVIQIEDIVVDPEYVTAGGLAAGLRTVLGVPLLREGTVVGVFGLFRYRVEPFTERQIELVRTFADQAVIAIENARLLTELRESLEQQQAIAEVLQVINASPGNLTPVYDVILEKAHTLCGTTRGSLQLLDGDEAQIVAARGHISVAVGQRLPAAFPPFRRLAAGESFVEIPDMRKLDDPIGRGSAAHGTRTLGLVPLRKEDTLLGIIVAAREEVRPFTDKQIALLQSFAAQAVIAMDNARLLTELRESLEQQQAIAEVLQVINSSPGNLQPVFDAILDKAHSLCGANIGWLLTFDGELVRMGASRGLVDLDPSVASAPFLPGPAMRRLIEGESFFQIPDIGEAKDMPGTPLIWRASCELLGEGNYLVVPLRKDGTVHGFINAFRSPIRLFSEKEIALLESFAAQAVIAMDNARLLTELRESLEQQQAMAEVLQVINASPGELTPVFDAILEKAHTLGGASRGALFTIEGDTLRAAATRGYPADLEARLRDRAPLASGTLFAPLLDGARMVHHPDLLAIVRPDDAVGREVVARGGVRTNLMVPLRKDKTLLGFISCNRAEVRPFTDKEITLLESFAAQAVIAMDNARLLNEIRQRQAELRVTFDNMGDAVIMFDGAQRLVAWNRNFLHMLDIPEEWLETPRSYGDFAAYLTERGEFGDTPPPDLGAPETGEVRPIRYERTRPDGRILEVRRNPIPGGAGFVFIYADITERKLAEQSILAAREAAEHALADLKLAQANLIQAEKMASLGQLTAGIAHEIKNPLNFVNNFANLSNELLGELKETAAPAFATLDADTRDEIDETMDMLSGNLEKIQEHGRRADGIVKSMLAHSRGGSGDRREADINALVEESLNLAYHGARAQDQNFNITLERDYDKAMKPIDLVPQDVTRVFLNLCGNGFYAANKRRKEGGEADFRPVLKVATRELGDAVEVRIRDNGTGIPPEIKAKLFQPFFTTKPTGEGTGLGLSISYDIVTQQHGGTIAIDSQVGAFTEFTIHLPRKR